MLIARGLAEASGKRIRLSTKAIVGATSKGLSGQIDAMFVAGPPPDAAVIMIGANDITRRQRHRAVCAAAGPSGAATAWPAARSSSSGTCPDFGVITAIPQPLRLVRTQPRAAPGAGAGRGGAGGGRCAGALSDLLAPDFYKAPEVMFSHDMFHPSAAGYALAAHQLLPALV